VGAAGAGPQHPGEQAERHERGAERRLGNRSELAAAEHAALYPVEVDIARGAGEGSHVKDVAAAPIQDIQKSPRIDGQRISDEG